MNTGASGGGGSVKIRWSSMAMQPPLTRTQAMRSKSHFLRVQKKHRRVAIIDRMKAKMLTTKMTRSHGIPSR